MSVDSRWRVLIFTYVSMLVFAVIFQAIPSVLSFIVSSLDISHAQAGALMSLFALPGILISIPGGILTDIYGPRRIGMAALAIAMVGSLMIGFGNNFPWLVAGRFISGIGALTIAIVAPQTISRWFAKKDLGSAMGIHNTAMPVGTILTLNIFGRLAGITNWRLPIILTAGFSLFVLVLFYFKHPGLPEEEKGQAKDEMSFKKGLISIKDAGWPVWLVAASWMMFNVAGISYLTFAGDYYITEGYDISYAGFLASLFMFGSLLFSPLVGYLTDKIGKQEYFLIGGGTALALLLLLVSGSRINPLLLGSLIGLSAAFVPAPIFSLVPKFLPPGQIGMGYGLLSTCLNIGVLVGPMLIGFSYDQTLSYHNGFILMAVFAFAAALLALVLRISRGVRS